MTRDEYHEEAASLLEQARARRPLASPARMGLLAEAQLLATLALSAPETAAPRKRTARKTTESKGDSK